jgi:hypothetical protein
VANEEIQAVAKAEGERLAWIVSERSLNRRSIPLTEKQFANYLAMMFRAGALWALDDETLK